MKLDAFVGSYGCTLVTLPVNHDTDPRYEVFAPEHKRFDGGEHSLVCVDSIDVRERLKQSSLSDCPDYCNCRE